MCVAAKACCNLLKREREKDAFETLDEKNEITPPSTCTAPKADSQLAEFLFFDEKRDRPLLP